MVQLTGAAAAANPPSGRGPSGHVKIRIGHTLSPESEYQKWCQRFGEALAKNTNGKYELQIYPSPAGRRSADDPSDASGTQGDADHLAARARGDRSSHSKCSRRVHVRSIDQGNRRHGPQGRPGLQTTSSLADGGLVSDGWGSVQERNIFTTSKPVRTLADLKG